MWTLFQDAKMYSGTVFIILLKFELDQRAVLLTGAGIIRVNAYWKYWFIQQHKRSDWWIGHLKVFSFEFNQALKGARSNFLSRFTLDWITKSGMYLVSKTTCYLFSAKGVFSQRWKTFKRFVLFKLLNNLRELYKWFLVWWRNVRLNKLAKYPDLMNKFVSFDDLNKNKQCYVKPTVPITYKQLT